MKSMTGFGTAEYSDKNMQVCVEIKTVNHRYRDFNIRLPRKYSPLEDTLRKHISETVSRGRIEFSIRVKSFAGETPPLKYSPEAANQYMDIIKRIKSDFPDAVSDISVLDITQFPDVIAAEEEALDINDVWEKLKPTVDKALDMLDYSRSGEGESLKRDFCNRLSTLKSLTANIESLAPELPKIYAEQLEKHLSAIKDAAVDEQRLYAEMAIYADKVNITEELVRIKLHYDNFAKELEKNIPIGRKLEFLLQEINREANTIASKSNSFDISVYAVEIKSELEKIREQLQNIE